MPPASPYISQSSIEYHVQTPGQIFPESGNGIFNIDPNPSQHYFQISQEIIGREKINLREKMNLREKRTSEREGLKRENDLREKSNLIEKGT